MKSDDIHRCFFIFVHSILIPMVQLKQVIQILEKEVPLIYQESYDNCGLLVGSSEMEVRGILLCLDCTEDVLQEALEKNANVIVAHHPLIFSGIKRITGSNATERILIKAIQNGMAIYAMHTNLDNQLHGVNAKLASRLGLLSTKILSPLSSVLYKLITYVPESHTELVRKSLFEAGAGQIGRYSECSFSSSGVGTFLPGEGSEPFVGEPGNRHAEAEQRLEVLVTAHGLNAALQHLKKAHPYEEPAYDVISLKNENSQLGAGLVGELAESLSETQLMDLIKEKFKIPSVRHTRLLQQPVQRIAVCGGSGSFLLKQAIQSGAQVFITADFKYHQFFEAENKIVIIDIGHYESEQFTPEIFYEILSKNFPNFAIHLSGVNTNPVNYY